MQTLNIRVTGINSLLTNNPQTTDPLNVYAKEMKKITAKRNRQDEDYLNMRKLEMEAKLYFDEDGVFVPSTWLTAAIAGNSWNTIKVKKADIRSSVFPTTDKLRLNYRGKENVKTMTDVAHNESFQHIQPLRQGQVRVVKATPKFDDWSFDAELEYDPAIIDEDALLRVLTRAATYGGFGDFRPTFGRASIEVL